MADVSFFEALVERPKSSLSKEVFSCRDPKFWVLVIIEMSAFCCVPVRLDVKGSVRLDVKGSVSQFG